MQEKILVVDDERLIRWTLCEALRGWGYTPVEAADVRSALEIFEAEHPVVTLLDINLPDGSGLDVLREIRKQQPDAIVIMITANVLVDDTIVALRGGAYDFIGKPINLEEILITMRNGIEARQMRRELRKIHLEKSGEFNFSQIIGDSPSMQEMKALAQKVASSDVSSVLLQGESGTGKDLLAKAIHYSSPLRSPQPFVAINCAAIPSTLIESELFGYEKGAFTDAKSRKEGLFEQADGGTLFLDEIGELGLALQAKLLRVLEEGSFRRVGGLKDLPLNVRVVAASNRDLRRDAETGVFRLDLYYRLSVIQIDIPPLRERGDDVLLLADHFIRTLDKTWSGARPRGLSPEVANAFRCYSWPGNVRELKNAIERALILDDSHQITMKYLPRDLQECRTGSTPGVDGEEEDVSRFISFPPDGISLEAVENTLINQALKRSGGNITRAGELLHISRDRVRYRLRVNQKKHAN
jgi:two-component system, NtrC family, response regulator AtoC